MDTLRELTEEAPEDAKSIKRIERLLDEVGVDGRNLTSPLVGVNELRTADAHLPSSDLSPSFQLLRYVDCVSGVALGVAVMKAVATCISEIAVAFADEEILSDDHQTD